ncbi:hypothetical protein K438DRAFT_1753428 [Mycena galopus ATCC 62051]|nr:hypothetical protein K438DRAFT_1753428 [Mycena galopus ATCC 62051]
MSVELDGQGGLTGVLGLHKVEFFWWRQFPSFLGRCREEGSVKQGVKQDAKTSERKTVIFAKRVTGVRDQRYGSGRREVFAVYMAQARRVEGTSMESYFYSSSQLDIGRGRLNVLTEIQAWSQLRSRGEDDMGEKGDNGGNIHQNVDPKSTDARNKVGTVLQYTDEFFPRRVWLAFPRLIAQDLPKEGGKNEAAPAARTTITRDVGYIPNEIASLIAPNGYGPAL